MISYPLFWIYLILYLTLCLSLLHSYEQTLFFNTNLAILLIFRWEILLVFLIIFCVFYLLMDLARVDVIRFICANVDGQVSSPGRFLGTLVLP